MYACLNVYWPKKVSLFERENHNEEMDICFFIKKMEFCLDACLVGQHGRSFFGARIINHIMCMS